MPHSVHKMQCHGTLVAKSFMIPIGQLSGEAQDSTNECNSRKTSRIDTSTDIFHRLLLSTDPLLSSSKEVKKKKKKTNVTLLCTRVNNFI